MEIEEIEDKVAELITNYFVSDGDLSEELLTFLKGASVLYKEIVYVNQYLTERDLTELKEFGFILRGWSPSSVYHKDIPNLMLTKKSLNDWVLTLSGEGVVKRGKNISETLSDLHTIGVDLS